MRDLIGVLILGAGQMGAALARLVLAKEGLELVGACDRRPELAGADLGRVIGLDRDLGITIEPELSAALAARVPDVALQATASELDLVRTDISVLLNKGVNVISIAEEMAYPWCRSAAIARELDELAAAGGVVALGTGINPGFVLDFLIIALSGVCSEVQSIFARRANDLSPYGPSVLKAQGVGLSAAAFETGVQDGTISGHVGFPQSMHMIADAIGWSLDEIEETLEPIIASERRETTSVIVEAGQVAGCRQTATARAGGAAVITLEHPQQIRPDLAGVQTADRIEIRGVPGVSMAGSPEIAGGEATAAIAVNMIPRVLCARPGLRTMADLPAPSALHGDVRQFLTPLRERHHG